MSFNDVSNAINSVKSWIGDLMNAGQFIGSKRDEYLSTALSELASKTKGFNENITVVVCAVDCDLIGQKLNRRTKILGRDVDIVVFQHGDRGQFIRHGDGGFINWAYVGKAQRDGNRLYMP